MNTSELIIAARKRGMTQEQIAKRSGTTQPTIARLMAGEYTFESTAKQKVDNWLTSWLQIVTFDGEVYILGGRS